MTQNLAVALIYLLVLCCSVDVHIWYGWIGQQRLLHLRIITWSVCHWFGLVNIEEVTPVGPTRHIVLVLLTFVWHFPVFPWCTMDAWSCLHISILHIYLDSHWLDSWGFSLTWVRYWSRWRVSVPAYDTILGVLIGGVLLPGVLDRTQWFVWDSEVPTVTFPLCRWGSNHCFSTSHCWVRLGIRLPNNFKEWREVTGRRSSDPILDGGVPPQRRLWICGTDRPLWLVRSVQC